MKKLTAADLIRLLATHIATHGKDVPVIMMTRENSSGEPVRCWLDAKNNEIFIGDY